jgi:hypothetical protein
MLLNSFDFLANAGIQDEENSSKRATALVDPEHLNKVIDPFGEFVVLDPRIREEDAGLSRLAQQALYVLNHVSRTLVRSREEDVVV